MKATFLIIAAVVLVGCGKPKTGSKLLGSWECIESMQPEENVTVAIEGNEEYFDNGRSQLEGTMTIDGGAGKLVFSVVTTGTWQLKGDVLTEVIEDAKFIPQNEPARQMAAKVNLNDLMPKGQTTQQRIVKVNDDVLVREDLDGENRQTSTRIR